MRQPTLRQRRAWARRAVTLHLKAQDLFADMMDVVGAEHPITNNADSLMEDAATLASLLENDALLIWKPRPTPITEA